MVTPSSYCRTTFVSNAKDKVYKSLGHVDSVALKVPSRIMRLLITYMNILMTYWISYC